MIKMEEISKKYIDKFWSKITIPSDTKNCWEWNRAVDTDGYGLMWVHSRYFKAHRISYFLNKNIDPKELFVLHKCDNPKCVNPNHLFLGTNSDNMKDMVKKGRGINKENLKEFQTNFPELIPRGENNHLSKLVDEQVLQIRIEYYKGGISSRELARKYNIEKSTVLRIVNRKTWTHI